MTVLQAHDICDRLEGVIKKILAGAIVTIHEHSGVLVS